MSCDRSHQICGRKNQTVCARLAIVPNQGSQLVGMGDLVQQAEPQ